MNEEPISRGWEYRTNSIESPNMENLLSLNKILHLKPNNEMDDDALYRHKMETLYPWYRKITSYDDIMERKDVLNRFFVGKGTPQDYYDFQLHNLKEDLKYDDIMRRRRVEDNYYDPYTSSFAYIRQGMTDIPKVILNSLYEGYKNYAGVHHNYISRNPDEYMD